MHRFRLLLGAACGLCLLLLLGAGWRGRQNFSPPREQPHTSDGRPAVRYQVATPPPTSYEVVRPVAHQVQAAMPATTPAAASADPLKPPASSPKPPASSFTPQASPLTPASKAEVDTAAVLRRGDVVQHTDQAIMAADEPQETLLTALADVPPDDGGKWCISVVTMQGCAPCQQLKAAWRADRDLQAWANPSDGKSSWAHYREYDREDKSQEFRWVSNFRFAAFPTVILQPPRDGSCGDPGTIVYGKVYPGTPAKLTEGMRDAMKRYLARQPRRAEVTRANSSGHAADDVAVGGRNDVGVDPPWQPRPKNDELPDYQPPLNVPPDEGVSLPSGGVGWLSLVLGAVLGQLTHLVPPAWRALTRMLLASMQAAVVAAQPPKAKDE